MIEVSALIDPEYLVEIEVTALRTLTDADIEKLRNQVWSVNS
jgi:hypothetical protein